MSKLSFRARQVDYTKPLPIYLNHDLPDLQDFAAINRSVPLMPTGMEKDEEAEHHLQRALSALQAFGATSSNEYAIPTPKVEIDNKMYERIYNIECPKQKQYIRIQPFSNDYDYPDYDADYEDENWLNEKKKTLPKDFNQDLLLYFETIMDRLEKVTSHSTILMSRDEAKLVLMKEAGNDDNINDSSSLNKQQKHKEELEEFLLSIYEYWKSKRLSCNHPLTPIVLTDKSGVVTQQNNPYLVFRRRTEKMQTRKNRKNEEQSYEKMLILKRDLYRAQHILKLIKKRENFKKEFLKLTLETFEKRYKLNDFDGSLTDSIACSLKPLLLNNTSQTTASIINSQQQPNTLNNLLNNSNKHGHNYNSQTNDINKNLSSIDKTIVNLINSNKLRTLGSPPHSSLKKLPQIEKDFMVDNIYKTSNSLNLKLTKQQQQLLSEKQQKRLKKEKLQQHQSTGINQNTISNLINNRKIYGEYEDLSTNNKSESNYNKITVNNNPNAAPLTNRSNNNIFNNNNIKRRNNILNNHKRSLNNANSNSNSSSDSNNNNNNNNNRYLTNENENLDSNNNKHSRNLNLNHHLYKNGDLINTNNNNNRLASNSSNSNDNNNNEDENSINNLNIIFNEFKEYEEELRQNQIENLDSILNEAKNRLSTTSDKDGYWCFKRKEGCKYLPQNGPIFKNDVLEMEEFLKPLPPPSLHYQASVIGQQQLLSLNSVIDLTNSSNNNSNNTDEIVNNNHFYQLSQQNKKHKRLEFKKKDRLKELQQFYYGYAITKHNRHLGLVRRRLGRGGRILLDKFNENLIDLKSSKNSIDYLTTNTIKKSNELKICPLNLSKFKTYYPIECYNLNNETNNNDLQQQQQQNIENKDKKITSNEQTLKKPESTSSMPPPPASSSVPKLKLKNFYDNELTSDITDYDQNCNDNLSKNFLDIDDDDFMFDHRLFSLYQFENENENKFLNELATDGDSNVNLEKKEDEEDVTMKSNHERKESGSSSTSSFVNLINENNNNDYEDLDFKDNDYNNNDDDDDFELIEYDECKNFKMNSELINNKVYDRTNLIRFDFSSMTKLNDEYHSSSNECRLNLSNVKQAITTLKIPPKITTIPTQINDFINIDLKNNDEFILKETNNESNDCIKIKDEDKLDEKKQSDQKLGESIANITSTTLTPPSPSPPMNISSPSKSEEIVNIITTTTTTIVPTSVPVPSIIIENKTNDINEQINNHFNASIANNKLLVSLPTTIMNPNNNITNNINNQTQSGRFLQSLNKIKNLNYSNDKIMQPLVNGTNNVITVSSTTIPNNNNNATLSTSTSTSSSPSSSSSSSLSSSLSQTYLVKKQINNNNNNNSINSITKSSSLFYSTTSPSSLPSSSSTSSSSSSSNIIINTPSTKLTNSSSPNLISLTGTIQQNNTNQIINSNNNSNNTNTIIVNGVLAKKKDENNPYLLNNNNFQNFHHIQQQQHQENQITSTTQTTNTVINANSNSLTNGLLPTQKLFQAIQFSTNSLPAGIINNNSNNSISNNNNNSNNLMNLMSNSSHHHHSNLFKTTSSSTSIINSPLQVPIALSSSHSSNSNSNNNNDLNSSTKII